MYIHTIIITIFMGSGWLIFSENTLTLYQQNSQLCPYFSEMANGDRLSVGHISYLIILQNKYTGPIS